MTAPSKLIGSGSKLRVLHVSPSFYPATHYGGPVESGFALCRDLAQAGCEIQILTTNANGPANMDPRTLKQGATDPRLKIAYCRRWALDAVAPRLLRLLPRLVRWSDVVHLTAVYDFPTIPTLTAAALLRRPLVWTPRGALRHWGTTQRARRKSAWERVCKVVLPSNTIMHLTSEEERQETASRFPNVDSVVIPNSVSIPARVPPRRRDSTLRLLFLGRLHPVKGISNLLEACAGLDSIEWTLTIAGAGTPDYEQALKDLAQRESIAQRVDFVGRVNRTGKEALFANADLLVAPSHSESFGIVVAEALAHGVAVIASQGTPWSRIREHECGLWVPNDPASLKRAIEDCSRQPLEELGERGRAWMREEFSPQGVAAQFVRVYEALTAAPQ